ncbi:hypothetical protein ACM39_02455 [Chryseobacterium sp. FH2]|uniref:hypothetical protein n=1 Tax=Chryseobacterium sp. FH2 TaxID=1674291 RepID=UPI00065ADDF0|nr:hypothetical protein [Chryseobacterium sp. FH2]KMQ69922.1 hypothetical protein ACM39_02455 [Chryseobacterium sp. FH2]
MNNEEQIQKQINGLELQLKDYDFIVKKLFDDPFSLSEEDKNSFIIENKEKMNERKKLIEEIADLRWSLMTPKEQKDYLDKYSDD